MMKYVAIAFALIALVGCTRGLQSDGRYVVDVKDKADNSDLMFAGSTGNGGGSYTARPECKPTDKHGCSDFLQAFKGPVEWVYGDGHRITVNQ